MTNGNKIANTLYSLIGVESTYLYFKPILS
nr:MAG TPA: hypothetical protein [Caudoviricetes sp.]